MNPEYPQWESIRDNYLKMIQKNLALVDHPRRTDILDNVRDHLDNKYAELPPEQKNWEGFQQVITEMGPAEEYAELLAEGKVNRTNNNLRFIKLGAIVFALVLAAVGSYLIYTFVQSPVPAAYVVTFKPVHPFEPQTARELLDAFNENHPSGVRTHHYRTNIEDEKLVGSICVDTAAAAGTLKDMLKQSDRLEFIKTKSVTQAEFEEHCLQKQVSLSSNQSSLFIHIVEPPVIYVPDLRVDDIVIDSPECTADFVQSHLGPPAKIDYDGKKLIYTNHGINLWFTDNKHLTEVHLNPGFKGKLDSGISMASAMQDVFDVYGQPIEIIQAQTLSRQNRESILLQKENTSRIYYGKHGLIFWFRDNAIAQIVPFKGSFTSKEFE